MGFIKSWRWFGPHDAVKLPWLRQVGVEEVVTALHHIPNGEIWSTGEIKRVKNLLQKEGLGWSVVESLPVSEAIKTGTPLREQHIENYKRSLENLAKCGLKTVVYNFMPVIDWVRTHLHYQLPTGGESMLFDYPTFAAFDVHILKRPDAERDYPEEILQKAQNIFSRMTPSETEELADRKSVV